MRRPPPFQMLSVVFDHYTVFDHCVAVLSPRENSDKSRSAAAAAAAQTGKSYPGNVVRMRARAALVRGSPCAPCSAPVPRLRRARRRVHRPKAKARRRR